MFEVNNGGTDDDWNDGITGCQVQNAAQLRGRQPVRDIWQDDHFELATHRLEPFVHSSDVPTVDDRVEFDDVNGPGANVTENVVAVKDSAFEWETYRWQLTELSVVPLRHFFTQILNLEKVVLSFHKTVGCQGGTSCKLVGQGKDRFRLDLIVIS